MTKPIIINGADVSGCEGILNLSTRHFGTLHKCCFLEGNCKDNPNCYFKQLQRKTEECNKHKEALIEVFKLNREIKAELKKITDEIEEERISLSFFKKLLKIASCERDKQKK